MRLYISLGLAFNNYKIFDIQGNLSKTTNHKIQTLSVLNNHQYNMSTFTNNYQPLTEQDFLNYSECDSTSVTEI